MIAGQIRRALGADLFEIEPAEPYPEDYEATVSQAQSEREAGYEPPLKAPVPNIELYEAIFLGFPIWGMTAPSVIRSFLSSHDLSDKTLVPFITHGGYGLGAKPFGRRRARAAGTAPRGLSPCKPIRSEKRCAQVTRWLGGIQTGK